MFVHRIAAFTENGLGGNPAGVVLNPAPLEATDMQRIAKEVGYSETAFATPLENGAWRVRYFAPESEVPFCGHATIALGAALANAHGAGHYVLKLNNAEISVEAGFEDGQPFSILTSPPTRSAPLDDTTAAEVLRLFGYAQSDLANDFAPHHAHAGADHLVIPLARREALSRMTYDLEAGRAFMNAHGLVTIAFVFRQSDQLFHVRNAFASGGVLEDPATGAAAAAFAGMLRDIDWPHANHLTLLQGEDMGAPSRIEVSLTDQPGAPVTVKGFTAPIEVSD